MQYHTNYTSDHSISLTDGLIKAIKLALADTKELLIYTGNKSIFNGNIIKNIIGQKLQKELLKNRLVKFEDITIFLEFKNSKKSTFKRGVIITPFSPPSDYSDVLDDNRGIDIVYVPWMEKEYDDYINKNSNSELIEITKESSE